MIGPQMDKPIKPQGNESREAIASLGGYAYQIYQAALAWIELDTTEFLFLEVAEDYVVTAKEALNAVQVKRTYNNVTINSDDIVASIDSFVEIQIKQPELEVRLRHLTTSHIGKEKSTNDRIGDTPTLTAWRKLSKTGDLAPLRSILLNSKLSDQTKEYIRNLEDRDFREKFLRRIHFDCGALDFKFLKRQLKSTVGKLLQERGGIASQVDGCLNDILILLLNKSIQPDDRFVDRARLEELLETTTRISINRAQFDAQNALIAQAFASTIPRGNSQISNRLAPPRPIEEVPLPSAIAQRDDQINSIVSSLEINGISWVLGAAGVGKTVAAKLAANKAGGNWASVNLRGLSSEQVSGLLNDIQVALANEKDIHGLLIDDFECQLEPYVLENFLNLLAACMRRDILIIVTAPRPPSSDLLFISNLTPAIETKLEEFTEADIQQILSLQGITDKNWAKYIFWISGTGHPQLAIAAIQSMRRSGWNEDEFRTLNSLMIGNSEVEQVRAQTRQRLLHDLPDGSRRLLERLSLTVGGFKRALVLDIAQIEPVVADGGALFDNLIGSWIDQQERDRFSLSPLLSNFAASTLTDAQKEHVHFEIANSLAKPRSLDPITANSALMAAWNGKNDGVIFKLCMSVLNSKRSDREMIAPHLMMLTHMRTDNFAYEDNPVFSQMLRGAQLILLCYVEHGADTFDDALAAFERDTARVQPEQLRSSMEVIVYSNLLLAEPIFGPLPNFLDIIQKFDKLCENKDNILPDEIFSGVSQLGNIAENISFMFLNQIRQTRRIGDLLSTFIHLDAAEREIREKIFRNYNVPEIPVDIDMLISGAWLKEHDAGTLDAVAHTAAYAQMENLANRWDRTDLAVACCKYQAVILDEYGNDKDAALLVIENGLTKYGSANSELIRAKAKILYRANDHQASLELSRRLIESGAPLSETERAFLGREAAISSEKQGHLEEARKYYIYAAAAAKDSGVTDMIPMHIGLLADAALTSWHMGDRANCLQEFARVLEKLAILDPDSSLRAKHCHAVSRHVLLWLDQEATGETRYIANGEPPQIYPGLVSNPEPHPDIEKRFLPALEMSWYMLAKIECHCLLDVGITENIDSHLPKGPVREGLFLLTGGKLRKAFMLRNIGLFSNALRDTIAEFAYATAQGSPEKSFNIENVTYAGFPSPTQRQIDDLVTLAEQQILSFAATCILNGESEKYDAFLAEIFKPNGYARRDEIVDCLVGKSIGTEYYTRYASLLSQIRKSFSDGSLLSPLDTVELTYKILQTAKQAGQLRLISEQALTWFGQRWVTIWGQQRFLLRQPSLYEKTIASTWEEEEPNSSVKLLKVLLVILPTLGISNQNEVRTSLEEMLGVV